MGKLSAERMLPDNEAKAVYRNDRISPQKQNQVAQSSRRMQPQKSLHMI
mgnify:CR=1 FL=1